MTFLPKPNTEAQRTRRTQSKKGSEGISMWLLELMNGLH